MKPLIAGNWKMNGLLADRKQITKLARLIERDGVPECEIALCLPFTLLFPAVKYVTDTPIALGAQDCHWAESGAYTGDVSPAMIAEAGCEYVIVGHSERRSGHGYHGERSQEISEKARLAMAHGIRPIVCVGESLDEREAGKAKAHVLDQVKKSLPEKVRPEMVQIAYEPIWAIGTGVTAKASDIAEMHAIIREYLGERLGRAGRKIRILYGGSVTSENAGEILELPDVNGVLVGGASLKARDFFAIIRSAPGGA